MQIKFLKKQTVAHSIHTKRATNNILSRYTNFKFSVKYSVHSTTLLEFIGRASGGRRQRIVMDRGLLHNVTFRGLAAFQWLQRCHGNIANISYKRRNFDVLLYAVQSYLYKLVSSKPTKQSSSQTSACKSWN